MADLRVIQVVLSLAPGGTERLVVELTRRMRQDCQSFVCCLDEEGAWAADVRRDGTPVIALNRQQGFHPSLGWRIATLVRQHRANVLHCHQYTPFIYGRIASALTGTGIVFTEHGRLSDGPPSLKRRLVNPVISSLGGSIFAVSNNLRQHMIAEGLRASKIAVIHNGVESVPPLTTENRGRARAALGLSPGIPVIGTAARLNVVKDLPTLISAFRDLRVTHPLLALVIFGDGPERKTLESLTATFGLERSVTFTGHLADVRDFLPALDIFVNCSTSEGISLTILEAMAAGLPVVATAVGGTPEIVVENETGFLVPARAPDRLAEALGQLLANPVGRAAMGSKGRARVLCDFTIDRMVADYLAQYRRIAQGQR